MKMDLRRVRVRHRGLLCGPFASEEEFNHYFAAAALQCRELFVVPGQDTSDVCKHIMNNLHDSGTIRLRDDKSQVTEVDVFFTGPDYHRCQAKQYYVNMEIYRGRLVHWIGPFQGGEQKRANHAFCPFRAQCSV